MDRVPGGMFGQGMSAQDNLIASLMAAARNPRDNALGTNTPLSSLASSIENQLMLEMFMAAKEGQRIPIAPRSMQNTEPAWGNAFGTNPPQPSQGIGAGRQPPTQQSIQNQLMLEMLMAAGGGQQTSIALRPTQSIEPAWDIALGTNPPQPSAGIRPGGQPLTQQAMQDQRMLEMLIAANRGHQTLSVARSSQSAEPTASSPSATTEEDDKPLIIPPKDVPLPPMDNMQLRDIRTPHPHDVLCGRGGRTNNHMGNEKFRTLVQSQKVRYLKSSKSEKLQVSRDIVRAVRAQNPPGRFLSRDGSRERRYYEIGNRKAREKTSQALREGAPDIRQKITKSSGTASTTAPQQHVSSTTAPQPHMSSTTDPQPQLPRPGASQPGANQQLGLPGRDSLFPMSAPSALFNASRGGSVEQQMVLGMQAANHFLNASRKPGASSDQVANNVMVQRALAEQMAAAMAAAGAPATVSGMTNQNVFAGLIGENEPPRSQLGAALNPRSALIPQPPPATPFGRGFGARSIQQGLKSPGFGRGSGLSPFLVSGAANAAPQLNMFKHGLSPEVVMDRTSAGFGGMNSFAASRAPRKSIAKTAKPSLAPLSNDLAHRLVLAETVAQRTLNGSVTEELTAEEKRMGLYLDAGLLGIDLREMAERLSRGQKEESIVEDCFNNLKARGREASGKRRGETLPAPAKKPRVAVAGKSGSLFREKDIQDALVAIGAAMK